MRIALCIASMGAGGAERVVGYLAGHWARHGHDVHVVTLADPVTEPFYPLAGEIRLHQLGLSGASSGFVSGVGSNVRRMGGLREALTALKPDVVISHVDAMNALVGLAMVGMRCPHIATEHIHPPVHPIGPAWSALRRLSYRLADRVVVLTEATRQWLAPGVRKKAVVIPNPVAAAVPVAEPERIRRFGRTVLGVGRLAPQKGLDRLLEAFALIAPQHEEWGVVLLGEGPERERLLGLAARLGLGDRVDLPGIVDNPTGSYLADIFCLPSRYEGFPMALCEAMAAGLPPVAFDCPTGPAEIIRHGVDGLLVPCGDVNALARSLDQLMGDGGRREAMGRAAVEGIRRFAPEVIMARWDELFDEVVK